MATVELARLTDHLEPAQIAAVLKAISEEASGDVDLNSNEDSLIIEGSIDDDVFVDFRDRLEANDLDADVYVPVEFEDVLHISSDLRIGSTYALQLVLDSLREDFFVEDPSSDSEMEMDDFDDEEADFERDLDEHDEASGYYEDEDSGIEMKDEQLRHVWRAMHKAVNESMVSNLPLFLIH